MATLLCPLAGVWLWLHRRPGQWALTRKAGPIPWQKQLPLLLSEGVIGLCFKCSWELYSSMPCAWFFIHRILFFSSSEPCNLPYGFGHITLSLGASVSLSYTLEQGGPSVNFSIEGLLVSLAVPCTWPGGVRWGRRNAGLFLLVALLSVFSSTLNFSEKFRSWSNTN